MKKVLFLLVLISCACNVNADAVKKQKRGLYWNERPVPVEDKKEEPEYKKPVIPPRAEMMKMHPQQIKALLQETLEYAVFTQSEDDVKNYYVVSDVMRRKSAGFAGVSGYVMMKNPELNSGQSYARTTPSKNQAKKDEKEEINSHLSSSKKDYALIMFTQPGCNACGVQKPIINRFSSRYGISVKYVDIVEHPKAQTKYNVTGTPITYLINKNSKEAYLPVSIGVSSESEITRNTYRAVRIMEGIIKPSQFYTRDRDLGKYFDPNAFNGEGK